MDVILAGRYHLIKPLGSGGFGKTYLATDRHLPGKPTCVVKQLQPHCTTEESLQVAKRLFNLEAETLYRLGHHDRIPRLLAHFEQDEEFYLVQEYIPGDSLQQELANRILLPEAEVIALLRDILEVLAFVHTQRVIHRDIKPSNLIRRRSDRRIVLIDFGAVKQVSRNQFLEGQNSFTVAIGSPGYMPVEQLSSQPHFSSDVYAVGMIALQALTGISPTHLPKDPQTSEIDFVVLGDRFTISPELAAILERMVRYDYRQRYATASEALQAINHLNLAAFTTTPMLAATVATPVASLNNIETLPPAPASMRAASLQPLTPHQVVARRTLVDNILSSQDYRNRQALLNKVKNYWVKGVLETSLHDQVAIVLGLELRPDAVASPWNLTIAAESQTSRSLPPNTPIVSVFDQMGIGRTLLILGDPGSGKTTTLLQLTRDLLHRAEQDVGHLLPVVLNLSSWADNQRSLSVTSGAAFADWIVSELNTKYQIPRKIAQPWVEKQQLLLLLDGLDEVPVKYRITCVAAINTFQQEYGTELVVCSRIKDYEALTDRLNVQTAVYLHALTTEQIYHYLDQFNLDLTGLKTLLQRDSSLRDLAQSPLMLNIMMLTYQNVAIEDVLHSTVIEERRQQLFDAYIQRMFQRRNLRQSRYSYPEKQAIDWLSWLAQQMVNRSQTVFLVEQLQPNWLPSRQRRLYQAAVLIAGMLIATPLAFSSGMLTNGWLEGWSQGLFKSAINCVIFGLVVGLIFRLGHTEIETVETLRWSWREAQKSLLHGLKIGLPIGLLAGMFFGLLGVLIPNFIPNVGVDRFWLGVNGGMTGGLTGGLIAGVIGGLRGASIETKTIPNQGIYRSLLSATISSLIGAVTGMFSVGLTYTLLLGTLHGLLYGIGYGLVGGMTAGFAFGGGKASVKHLMLRLILWRQAHIPWNYARFLNYCCDRVFLQKVGGGYIFIHRSLMEHFAKMK